MQRHRLRSFPSLRGTVLAAALWAGSCAGPAAPRAEEEVGRAAGLEPIEFRVEGMPLDMEPHGAERLALPDAVRLAVERDAELQAALARVRAALADAEQARLLPNPLLTLVVRWPEGGGRADIETGIAADLAALLKRPRTIDAADKRLSATVHDAMTASLDAVAGVRTSYSDAQALDEGLRILRERRAVAERLVGLARARFEFGEAARLDVVALEAQRAELDVDLEELELRRRAARLALARKIGEPSSAAEWSLDPRAPLPEAAVDEEPWVKAALARRPEIQSLAFELAALGDEAALAELSLWDGASAGLVAEGSEPWSMGPEISAPLPLFDLGGARRARAEAEVAEARHALTGRARGVIEEVRRALSAFLASRAGLERVRGELIPLQEQRLADVEAVYRAGHADATALLFAEQDLQAAQTREIDLAHVAATSLVELERAVGGPAVVRELLAAARAGAPAAGTEAE